MVSVVIKTVSVIIKNGIRCHKNGIRYHKGVKFMGKRFFAALFALIICFSIIISGVFPGQQGGLRTFAAFAAGKPTATVASVSAEPGETIKLSVTLSGARTLKSMMISDVTYNAEVLELKKGVWKVEDAVIRANYKNNTASMALDENTDINGVIFELEFAVKAGAARGSNTVSLTLRANYAVPGSEDVSEPITVVSGKVSVICRHANKETRNARSATCTETGYTGDVYCKTCGEKISSGAVISALGHTGGTATCVSKAICTRCGKEYGTLNTGNHTGGTELRNCVEATETEQGYTGDTYCLGCGAIIEKGNVIEKTGHTHSMTYHEGVEATCTKEGSCAYWSCDLCQKNFADKEGAEELDDIIIPKDLSKHTGGTEIINAKEATETEDGYTGDTVCSGCGEVLKAGEVIPKTGEEEPTPTETPKKNIIDSGLISVESESGFDADTELFVNALSYEALKDISLEGQEFCIAYETRLEKKSAIVTTTDTVRVNILIPEDLRSEEELTVYRINGTESLENMNATRDGNYLVFETDELSCFGIAKATANTEVEEPKTETVMIVLLAVLIVLVIALIMLIIIIKKKNKRLDK